MDILLDKNNGKNEVWNPNWVWKISTPLSTTIARVSVQIGGTAVQIWTLTPTALRDSYSDIQWESSTHGRNWTLPNSAIFNFQKYQANYLSEWIGKSGKKWENYEIIRPLRDARRGGAVGLSGQKSPFYRGWKSRPLSQSQQPQTGRPTQYL